MSRSRETVAAAQLYCPTCERTFASGPVCPTDGTRLVDLATPDALIGRILDGRYTIVSKLGSGGMGSVYRATQHSVGREVAIKVVAANLVSDAVAIKRFLREAKLASKLSHPNAVGVLDFGQTADHVFFLVMELVEGRTLEDTLVAEPVLPAARVIRIGMQICDALEGAHGLQIVHRDLKPANVMLLAGGRDHVKVLDFGIARSLAAGDENMTHEGSALGTPAFMPPEVASGRAVDARADLYSLGCMLYLMATGRPPFVGSSDQQVLTMHLEAPPAPMYGVPDALATIVLRLLEKVPDHRFPTATATREALEAAMFALQPTRRPAESVLGGSDERTMIGAVPEPTVAQPPAAEIATAPMVAAEPPAPIARPPRSSRGLVFGLAAAGAIGVAVGVFAAIRTATGDDPPPRAVATQPMKVIAAEPPDASAVAAAPMIDAAVAAAPALDASVEEATAAEPPVAHPAKHHHHPAARPDAGVDESHTPF